LKNIVPGFDCFNWPKSLTLFLSKSIFIASLDLSPYFGRQKDPGLRSGAVGGIVGGVLGALLLVCVAPLFVVWRKKAATGPWMTNIH